MPIGVGVVGSLAATGLTAGVPALISHIMNKNRKTVTVDDPKYKEILQKFSPTISVTNIIGSGIRKSGAGIKKF